MRVARVLPALAALAALAAAASAGAARAQTMLDQEERLIDIHALLLDLPPVAAPGALRPGQLGLGVEVIGIPDIDGTTGGRTQLTASDRTPAFPRPRIALGLPAPSGLRAFVGGAYIPPVSIREVETHYGALEAGIAWAPGPLAIGLRGHAVRARSRAPVTARDTRDELVSSALGAEVSAGYRLDVAGLSLTPYAGAGLVGVDGDFTVTSDGVELESSHTGASLHGGVRVLFRERWEAVAQVAGYPGRLVHPSFRVGYVADVWRRPAR